jgi:cystathionine gamma-synthase
VKRFVAGLEFFSLAESLGGVESLVAHPGSMTHAAMAPEARAAAGLVDGLLRLSIGIEAVEDLREDLAAGLARVRNS